MGLWNPCYFLNLSQSLFYWIIYSYSESKGLLCRILDVSILILLDYLFLFLSLFLILIIVLVSILILLDYLFLSDQTNMQEETGNVVSILILLDYLFLSYGDSQNGGQHPLSQSLFYWIIYSYQRR